MDEPHGDETQPDQGSREPTNAPPAGTAGIGNENVPPPPVEGGQPAVGDEGVRETRNTEF